MKEGVALLEPYLSTRPDDACLLFWLGTLELRLKGDRTLSLLTRAAEKYSESGDAEGEAWALINVADYLRLQGRLPEAEKNLERALQAATTLAEPTPLAMARISLAQLRQSMGDLSQALHWLRQAESVVCPQYYYLCKSCLLTKGTVTFELGDFGEAREIYERVEAIAQEVGDEKTKAAAFYDRTIIGVATWRGADRGKLRAEFLKALEMAAAADHEALMAKVHLQLGKLSDGREAREHLDRCVGIARKISFPKELAYCLDGLGMHVASDEPRLARKYFEESRALGLETKDPWIPVIGSEDRMYGIWALEGQENAYEESLKILDEIEILRDIQSDSTSRANFFSIWTTPYYSLSGRVLDGASEPLTAEDAERAFSVTERLRSRVLLDALDMAGTGPELPVEDPLEKERQEVLQRIVQVQRRLLDPELTPEQKAQALGDREEAEAAEIELGERIASSHPDYAVLKRPTFTSLSEVSASLADNEALLSFQLAPWQDVYGSFAGGSWLLVATRDGTRAYRLPDRYEIEDKVKIVQGLIKQRADRPKSMVTLYDELLGRALSELPGDVEKLVIIPDGSLHLLPFAALRAGEDGPPLAAKFRISAAPSATLWLRWRQDRPAAAAAALAFADPALPAFASEEGDSAQRSWLREDDIELLPLEHAAREGKAVVRHLGKPSVLQRGEDASESFLKHTNLHRFAILHFATHALVNEFAPGRSAILLAPGADDEDGLLQFRDIVELNLNGKLVVLSACRSASGTLLRGEGVLSLARAFFQAGAHTVVGSLWPIRDDEAANLIDGFYRYLAEGLSVAEALRQAQLEKIRDGAPVAAWAGLTVLGDGGYVPFPGGRPKPHYAVWVAGGLGVIAAAFLVGGYYYRRWTRPWTRLKRLKRA